MGSRNGRDKPEPVIKGNSFFIKIREEVKSREVVLKREGHVFILKH